MKNKGFLFRGIIGILFENRVFSHLVPMKVHTNYVTVKYANQIIRKPFFDGMIQTYACSFLWSRKIRRQMI